MTQSLDRLLSKITGADGYLRAEVLAAVAVVALLLRVGMVFGLQTWEMAWGDEEWEIARSIAAGQGFSAESLHGGAFGPTSQKAPAIPYLLALSIWIGYISPFLWFQLSQACAGAVSCWWLGRLGERVLGPTVGMLSAIMLALYVPHIWWIKHTGEHIFAGAALLGVLLLLYRAEQAATLRACALWGVSVGLAGFVSGDLLLPAPLFALWLAWRRRGDGWRLALAKPLVAGLVALAVLSPWTLRNYRVHGELVLLRTGFGTAFWWGNNSQATGTDWYFVPGADGQLRRVSGRYYMPDELERRVAPLPETDQERLLTQVTLRWIADNPGHTAWLTLKKFGYYWWFNYHQNIDPIPILREIAWASVLLFFLIGSIFVVRSRPREGMHRPTNFYVIPLFFPLITSTFIHVITVVSSNWRMRLPIEPLVLLLATYGLLALLEFLRDNGVAALE